MNRYTNTKKKIKISEICLRGNHTDRSTLLRVLDRTIMSSISPL